VKALLRRIAEPCCGMKRGDFYEAEIMPITNFCRVKLPSGKWSGEHWIPGLFEIIKLNGEYVTTDEETRKVADRLARH
jgi:hypothetical protein